MDYCTANEKLTGRNMLSRKVGNNTYLVRNSGVPGDSIHLKLHDTYIITWYADGRIVLNTGGWFTVTTKARINQFVSGYRITQDRGVWYITHTATWQSIGVFADGLTILSDGTISGMLPLADAKQKNKLRRRVSLFAKNYILAFKNGNVPAPSDGDCFYCAMRTVSEGKTLGETVSDKDHIMSHLDENYFVPALLHRAYEVLPRSQVMGWTLAKHWGTQDQNSQSFTPPDFAYDQLQKNLYRYILRQLGQAS